MLKGLDPLLSPDLLRALSSMGHGDELVLADANYPVEAAGCPVIRLDGHPTPKVLDAILSVLPLDSFVPDAAFCMAVVDRPDADEPIFEEFRTVIRKHEGEAFGLAKLERFAFYERARQAFVVVATGERRFYGNLIVKKGVIALT